jgi:hypothetical protein
MSFKQLKQAVRASNCLLTKSYLEDLNISLEDGNGFSIIWYVNRYDKGSIEMYKLLFEYVNTKNCKNGYNQNLLHVAIEEFNYKLFDLLLDIDDMHIDELDDCGMSALHYAVYNCSAYFVEKLIEKNACIMVADFEGYTPLHYLAMGTRSQFGDCSKDELYHIYYMMVNKKRLTYKGSAKYSVIRLAILNNNKHFLEYCEEFYPSILEEELNKINKLKNKKNF